MANSFAGEKSNGRIKFVIDDTVVVSGTNTDWLVGDSNGSSTDLNVAISWDGTKSFFAIKFGNTDQIFIDCQE